MYFSVWTHAHYSNTSSPIRPYRSHRSQREHIRCLIFPTHGNHSDKMKSAEFIAVSIWFFHFRKKSSIWSRGKWNLGRESAPTTQSSTACQLWSVSIIWVWSHEGVGMGTDWPSGLYSSSHHSIWIFHLLSPVSLYGLLSAHNLYFWQTLLTEIVYRLPSKNKSRRSSHSSFHPVPISHSGLLILINLIIISRGIFPR